MKERYSAAWAMVIAACLWGCNNAADSSQYKTYNQLLSDQKAAPGTPTVDRSASTGSDATEPPVSAAAAENASEDTTTSVVTAPVVSAATDNARPNGAAPADSNGPILPKSLQSFVPKPGGIQLLVDEPKFRVEASTGAVRVSYDDLDLFRVLNMEPVPDNATDYFPDWLKELNGKRIRIRGFMRPSFESTGLEGFVLARDTGACCFGPNAKIYYLIGVSLQPGKTVDYTPNRPFDVVGNLHIELMAEGGKQFGLYRMDDAQVIWR
jgi:hypothetical protein